MVDMNKHPEQSTVMSDPWSFHLHDGQRASANAAHANIEFVSQESQQCFQSRPLLAFTSTINTDCRSDFDNEAHDDCLRFSQALTLDTSDVWSSDSSVLTPDELCFGQREDGAVELYLGEREEALSLTRVETQSLGVSPIESKGEREKDDLLQDNDDGQRLAGHVVDAPARARRGQRYWSAELARTKKVWHQLNIAQHHQHFADQLAEAERAGVKCQKRCLLMKIHIAAVHGIIHVHLDQNSENTQQLCGFRIASGQAEAFRRHFDPTGGLAETSFSGMFRRIGFVPENRLWDYAFRGVVDFKLGSE